MVLEIIFVFFYICIKVIDVYWGNNLVLVMFNVLLKMFNCVIYNILFLIYYVIFFFYFVCKGLSVFFV